MQSNQMKKLADKLGDVTGLDTDDVSRVLNELANLAYSNAASGFVLPGFGKFRLVPGAETEGINPFTGKTTVFRAPPEVEFTIDKKAKQGFLAGEAEQSESIADSDVGETLARIVLVPDKQDMIAAGIESREDLQFKVGGEPDWLQAPEVPVCCGTPMLFYGQLDSLGGEYCIGDMGMLYIFFCQSCCSSRSIMQF